MPPPRKHREVVKQLRKSDSRFEIWLERGKGSECLIYHPNIQGSPVSIPVTHHDGNNTELDRGHMARPAANRPRRDGPLSPGVESANLSDHGQVDSQVYQGTRISPIEEANSPERGWAPSDSSSTLA